MGGYKQNTIVMVLSTSPRLARNVVATKAICGCSNLKFPQSLQPSFKGSAALGSTDTICLHDHRIFCRTMLYTKHHFMYLRVQTYLTLTPSKVASSFYHCFSQAKPLACVHTACTSVKTFFERESSLEIKR